MSVRAVVEGYGRRKWGKNGGGDRFFTNFLTDKENSYLDYNPKKICKYFIGC